MQLNVQFCGFWDFFYVTIASCKFALKCFPLSKCSKNSYRKEFFNILFAGHVENFDIIPIISRLLAVFRGKTAALPHEV